MSAPRDPRVYRDGAFRTVLKKRGSYVFFDDGSEHVESEPLNSWRTWCLKAEVKVTAV